MIGLKHPTSTGMRQMAVAGSMAITLFAMVSLADGTARINVRNVGTVKVELDDGTVIVPGSSAFVEVQAGQAGEILGVPYRALEPGDMATIRVVAPKLAVADASQETGTIGSSAAPIIVGKEPDTDSSLEPGTSMWQLLLDFRVRFSDDPTNTLAKYANVSPSHAGELLGRMTCRMPGELRGFFRDLVRRTMPWVEPLPGGQAMVCLYNPWCDGSILFPVRQEGDSFVILASPAIVAGEFLRDVPADAGVAHDDEDWAERVSSNVRHSHLGFRSMAKGGRLDIKRFGLWDDANRQMHLKAVFSRLGELMKEQAGVVLLEAAGKPGAVRYGAFLETLGKKGDVSGILDPSAAKTWGGLPEAFRESLWPVRATPCADGVLTVWQSMLVPETALFIEFSDESEDGATSISFLDFE